MRRVGPIRLLTGDLTRVNADAVVNAANPDLIPGGGVSGAIHRAGGRTIAEECRAWVEAHGPLQPGGAAITGAGRLRARHVIHSVGPIWDGGRFGEADALAAAYRSALRLADAHGLASVAFPSISTGIYGYPVADAARIALTTLREELCSTLHVRDVTFVLFDEPTHETYARVLDELERRPVEATGFPDGAGDCSG